MIFPIAIAIIALSALTGNGMYAALACTVSAIAGGYYRNAVEKQSAAVAAALPDVRKHSESTRSRMEDADAAMAAAKHELDAAVSAATSILSARAPGGRAAYAAAKDKAEAAMAKYEQMCSAATEARHAYNAATAVYRRLQEVHHDTDASREAEARSQEIKVLAIQAAAMAAPSITLAVLATRTPPPP